VSAGEVKLKAKRTGRLNKTKLDAPPTRTSSHRKKKGEGKKTASVCRTRAKVEKRKPGPFRGEDFLKGLKTLVIENAAQRKSLIKELPSPDAPKKMPYKRRGGTKRSPSEKLRLPMCLQGGGTETGPGTFGVYEENRPPFGMAEPEVFRRKPCHDKGGSLTTWKES